MFHSLAGEPHEVVSAFLEQTRPKRPLQPQRNFFCWQKVP